MAVCYTLTDLRVSTMSSLEGEGAGGEDTSHPWIGRNFDVKLGRRNYITKLIRGTMRQIPGMTE